MGVPGFRNPANLAPPFAKGNTWARRSNATEKAMRAARKLTPEAIRYCAKVMRDEEADTRHRLKASEIILAHGMPKGDAHRRALESIDGGVNSLRVEFISADGSVVSFEQAGLPPPQSAVAPAIIEVPFDDIGASKVSPNVDRADDADET